MVKRYIHSAVLLFFSWNIYASCQKEAALPLIAGSIVVLSSFLRLGSTEKRFKLFERLPLFAVILLSLVAGYFYRSSVPMPEEAMSPFPELTAAIQSAAIIASVLLWLKPFNRHNFFLIIFMAWLTVTSSINVPYSRPLFLDFSIFTLLSVVIVILNTFHRPPTRKHIFRYYRNFTFFSFLLIALMIVSFFNISTAVRALDEAFMNVMRNYIMPRHYTHFLNISPQLNLISPGNSAFDRRPVLEVKYPGTAEVYLRTQVFRDFNNGVWKEPEDLEYIPVGGGLTGSDKEIELTMFTSLKDIVPSPPGLTEVRGPGAYEMDENWIVYDREERRSRILTFLAGDKLIPARLTRRELFRHIKVPPDMAADLKAISSSIVGNETDPAQKALLIKNFFQNEFAYSLETDFRADNKSLIAMMRERRPAYCTYFATAMALLLRAENIPARVVTGFYTQEMTDRRQSRFLARVRDAHAWVEVLLLAEHSGTGERIITWTGLDPTPAGVLPTGSGRKKLIDLDRLAEQMWLGFLRFSAHVQNMDKDRLKMNVLLTLMAVMLVMNAKAIILGIKRLLGRQKQKKPAFKTPAHLQAVYRRYEQYLKRSFGETRGAAETDEDVVERLKKRPDVPAESLNRVESFLEDYHAARFGEKNLGTDPF